MKTINCPQCGGVLHLTQYPGVYHCRYCRNLIESNVIALHQIELQKYQLQLQEQALLEQKTLQSQKIQKLRRWQYLCAFWWGFIILTFLLGMLAYRMPSEKSLLLGELISVCLRIRCIGSPIVSMFRPDNCYPIQEKPACSQSALLFLFWFADMFQWVFVILIT